MAHKVLVGGTAYDLTGGKALINGTEYSVTKGRTLVGGTGYDVSFVKATFDEVIAGMSITSITGRNNSSSATVSRLEYVEYSRPIYVLQFLNGDMSITKLDCEYIDSATAPRFTKTDLNTSRSGFSPYVESGVNSIGPYVRAYISTTGAGASSVYGGTIAIVDFPSYPYSVVDKAIQSVTLTKKAGRNTSSANNVYYTPYVQTDRVFACVATQSIAYSSPLGTVVFYTSATSNPSLLLYTPLVPEAGVYLSTDGQNSVSTRGGSIVAVTDL